MGDEQKRNETLESIERLAENRLPICQTLFKFYVKYNIQNKFICNIKKSDLFLFVHLFVFETGPLCISLAVLELTL